MPGFNLSDADVTAVAEYIHSVLAKVGGAGPPAGRGRSIDPERAGWQRVGGRGLLQGEMRELPFGHRGDLKGYRVEISRIRERSRTPGCRAAAAADAGSRRGGGGGKPTTVTVTFADGQKLEGMLVRKDDFIVTLTLPDGTRKSIARDGDVPKVEVHDPDEAHKKLVLTLDDKDMHDVTAYLATVK